MANLPNSFQEFIQHASDYTSFSYKLREYASFESTSSPAHVFYVVNYTAHTYFYVEPALEEIFGYDKKPLPDEVQKSFTELWNRNDVKTFNEKIFPETIKFLKQYSVSAYPKFSFAFNYRVKAKDGKDYTLLQRSTYFSDAEDGNVLAAVGSIVDITNYKPDSSIIHTVEMVNRANSDLSPVPLFKSIYHPDKTESILSKRELEILGAIYEGMGSKQIADKFSVSINTVNNHRKNMLHKTNTNNASELLRYAMKNGLL